MNNEKATLIESLFPGLPAGQMDILLSLEPVYREWNAKINVISRKDMDAFLVHHVMHSLALARFCKPRPGWRVLDVGTGGGFPGIPLAILFPETQFVLADSIAKKIKVVSEVCAATGIRNVEPVVSRVEWLSGPFDMVVSRAVTRLAGFYPWVSDKVPHLGVDGRCMAFLKGGDLRDEIAEFRQFYPQRKIYTHELSALTDLPFFETKKLLVLT